MQKIVLKGITWGHSRGFTPLVAAAQRFSEIYPQVEIQWHKRSLQEFADFPIEKLTEHYDLLIIDHPWVGCAAATRCVLPLDQHLPAEYLEDQKENSVGASHPSYFYGGHQWALAIDAATPVASYREDLLRQNNTRVPQTWNDVLALARKGKVAVPAIPIDLLMNFYTFCIALGSEPFKNRQEVVDEETGLKALESMYEMYSLVDREMFDFNPIKVAEAMTRTDKYWYCPFAYGYSNYSRSGYADHVLHYTDLVHFNQRGRLHSTLGGTGLAVSAFCKEQEWALKFAEMVVSSSFQSTFYVENGGQPGHRQAWIAEGANRLTNNYFRHTLPALQRAYVRPRYNGYLHFQDLGGNPVQAFLKGEKAAAEVLKELNALYQESLEIGNGLVEQIIHSAFNHPSLVSEQV